MEQDYGRAEPPDLPDTLGATPKAPSQVPRGAAAQAALASPVLALLQGQTDRRPRARSSRGPSVEAGEPGRTYAVAVVISEADGLKSVKPDAAEVHIIHGMWRNGAWVGELVAGTGWWNAHSAPLLLAGLRARFRLSHRQLSTLATVVFVVCVGCATAAGAMLHHWTSMQRSQRAALAGLSAEAQRQLAAAAEREARVRLQLAAERAARRHGELQMRQIEAARNDDLVARDALNLLLSDDVATARPKIERALSTYRANREVDASLRLLVAAGNTLCQRRHYDAAEQYFRRALDDASAAGLSDGEPSMAAHLGLVAAYQARERHEEAYAHLDRVYRFRARVWDRHDPRLLQMLGEMIELKIAAEDWRLAEALARYRAEVRAETMGPYSPEAAEDLGNLAWSLFQQQRWDDALAACRQLILIDPALEPTGRDRARRHLRELAIGFAQKGRSSQALVLLERALADPRGQLRLEGVEDPGDLRLLARLYLRQNRLPEAEAALRLVLSAHAPREGEENAQLADDATELADLYERQQRNGEAEALHRLAMEIREKVLGPFHPDVARSTMRLAELSRIQGKSSQADALYELARDIRAHASRTQSP